MRLEFFVPGEPVTQGSKTTVMKDGKPIVNPHTGRPIMIEAKATKLRDWRATVKWYADQAYHRQCVTLEPIRLVVTFWRPRRAGDFRSIAGAPSRLLRASADAFPKVRPDSFKLCRAVEDALTGVIWADDAQIVDHHIFKRYCRGPEQPGVHIVIETMDNSVHGKDYQGDDAMRAEPTLFEARR